MSLERITIDGEECILTILNDITEQRQVKQELDESHERCRAILNGMFTFVGLLSLDGIVLEVNHAPLEAAGLRREDVIGKQCSETYFWAYSPTAQAKLRDAMDRAARGEIVRYDAKIQYS